MKTESVIFCKKQIRFIRKEKTGKRMFFAKDAAEVLEYGITQSMTKKIPDPEKEIMMQEVNGREQRTAVISEDALYLAAFGINNPDVTEKFLKWYISEIHTAEPGIKDERPAAIWKDLIEVYFRMKEEMESVRRKAMKELLRRSEMADEITRRAEENGSAEADAELLNKMKEAQEIFARSCMLNGRLKELDAITRKLRRILAKDTNE